MGRADRGEQWDTEVVRLPEEEIALLRSFPAWRKRVAAAHTFTREDRADREQTVPAERFGGMRVPALLLTGSEGARSLRRSVDHVAPVLPNARVDVLEGHGHMAHLTAPELVAAEILDFA